MQTNGFYVPVSSCNSFSKLLLPISVLLCISISALPAHLRSPSAGSVSQSSDSIWLSPGVPLSENSINFIPESNSLLASSTRWSGALAKPHHLSFVCFFIWWTFWDSNPGPTDYEPVALTCWAKCPQKKKRAPVYRTLFFINILILKTASLHHLSITFLHFCENCFL